MNDTLKVAGRIGAELGAAKAENEKLRGLLEAALYYVPSNKTELRTLIDAALSQQPEPTDTYTAVDMATAAAQGFRDGQAAVEQAAAQDETEPVYQFQWREIGEGDWIACSHSWFRFCEASPERDTRVVEVTRPAQTEQQPAVPAGFVLLPLEPTEAILDALHSGGYVGDDKELRELYQSLLDAAPIAQTAPQGKFRIGDLVKKSTGSEWEGHICGTYSTELTPEGYAVESAAHRGSVQIYPAKALELVPAMDAKEE